MIKRIVITNIIILTITSCVSAQYLTVLSECRNKAEMDFSDSITHNIIEDTADCVYKIYGLLDYELQQETDPRKKAESISVLCNNLYLLKNVNGGQRCVQMLYDLYQNDNNLYALIQASLITAQRHIYNKRLTYAAKILNETLGTLEKQDDYCITTLFCVRASVLLGHYEELALCTKFIQKGVNYSDNYCNDPMLKAEAYYRTALLYTKTGMYKKAKIFCKWTINICEHYKFDELLAKTHMLTGDLYILLQQPNLALYRYELCLPYFTQQDNKYFLGKIYNGIGNTYLSQNKIDEAIKIYNISLEFRNELGNNIDLAQIHNSFGNLYIATKQIDSAEFHYTLAFNFAKKARYYKEFIVATEALSKIYRNRNDWKRAYQYQSLAYTSQETLNQNINTNDVLLEELRGTLENEIINKQKLVEQNNQTLKEERATKIWSTIAVTILCIFLAITIVLIRKKKKKNNQLREQKTELEKRAILLQEQQGIVKQQAEILSTQNSQLEIFSIVVQQTDNSIFVTDPDGNFTWNNEAFTQHTGYNVKEFLSKNDNSILKASPNPEIKKIIEKMKVDLTPVSYTSQLPNKKGGTVWLRTTISPAVDSNNNVTMFIVVCTDITDLKKANERIEKQNKEIKESLEYARKIQEALQQPQIFVDYVLGEYFDINLPKNIVSGDFHWVGYKNEKAIFILGDCTGHGIPGGFMSMLEQVIISNVLQDSNDMTSAELLNIVRDRNIRLLHQCGRFTDSQDGMDASVFVFDRKNMILNFAGAYSLAYIIKFGSPDSLTKQVAEQNNCLIIEKEDHSAYLIKLKPNRFPVGAHPRDNEPFSDIFFNVNDGDIVYTTSDGYIDQYDKTETKRFKASVFERTILNICHLPLPEQKSILTVTFLEWKGNVDQTDDVHVFVTTLRKKF